MPSNRHRCPPHLRGEARKEFIALNDEWDQKLRDDEFVDIEAGRDLNRLATSTFSGGAEDPDRRRSAHCSLDQLGSALADEQAGMLSGGADVVTLARTETAEFWRLVAKRANDLPLNFKNRAYLVQAANAGMHLGPIAEKHRLSRRQARTIWDRFVITCGLPLPTMRRALKKPADRLPQAPPVPKELRAEFRRRYSEWYAQNDQLIADLERNAE